MIMKTLFNFILLSFTLAGPQSVDEFRFHCLCAGVGFDHVPNLQSRCDHL